MHRPNDFVLHGGDTAFANRQKLLFDQLSRAEQECNVAKTSSTSTKDEMEIVQSTKTILRAGQKRKAETKRFRGKESIFKRPEGPAPRASFRSIPDHRRNPHKWMRYSLDDVSNADMTDTSNTQAALSFLKELKARKSKKRTGEVDKMDLDEDELNEEEAKVELKSRKAKPNSQIEFRKPESNMETEDGSPVIIEHNDKPVFRSSKIVMPEYVVGQKLKKKTKKDKPVVKVNRMAQLKLDHLDEYDGEED